MDLAKPRKGPSESLAGVTLTWRDLSVYAVKRRSRLFLSPVETYTRIINNVNGAVLPGMLVALMGSSGAGKSTLMATLAHRAPAGTLVDGDVRVDGQPVGDFMRHLSGFVHQQEAFVSSLTVREHLTIMARLKMDRRVCKETRELRVRSLIKKLGLEHRADCLIGEPGARKVLSGGERKRVAFATELLTDPELLFCDEPTTGLDSVSAQSLVELMRAMAAQGKTILCTIHQPSSEVFEMFHQLILLADGGRVAFMGSTMAALEFFSTLGTTCPPAYNPADYLVRCLAVTPGAEDESRYRIKRMCDQFVVSDAAQNVDTLVRITANGEPSAKTLERSMSFKAPFWTTKLLLLTWRALLQVIRDPSVQWLRIVQKIAIAVTAGLCYVGTDPLTQNGVQSVQGALFIFVTENVFSPMYAALSAFHSEMPLFKREFASGLYSTHHYYVAKAIAELPGQIVEPTLFILAAYWLIGLRCTVYAVVMTVIIATLTMNVSTACGWFFAAAFESVSIAMTYLVPFDYILMITSGVFVRLSTIPEALGWMQYLSWLMYSTEAFSIIQWDGVTNITCIGKPGAGEEDVPCLRDGFEVLYKYSFASHHLPCDILMMVLMYFAFHLLAYVCLNSRARKK